MKRIKIWFRSLSIASRVAIIVAISIIFLGAIGTNNKPVSNTVTAPTDSSVQKITKPNQTVKVSPKSKPEPKIEIKTTTTTETIPYTSSTINDSSIDQGVTQTKTQGVNGLLTHTYQVTYTDGVETSRSAPADSITTPATNEVIVVGTKSPTPICENGTYVNSAGNTVCSPYSSPSAPSGASAQCKDGSYSFSQSRSGTCSHHGGVSIWL